MSTNHTEYELTTEQKAAIAFHADLEGKSWSEIIDERFPIFPDLNEEELQESLAMIDLGMAQIKAGEGLTVEQARLRTRKKLGIDELGIDE